MVQRPDIVIPVREGAADGELRYCLRSIAAHVPHRRVWIAGYMPPWVQGVGHIPTQQGRTKYENSRGNWKAAFDHDEVADEVVIFNDDFFVMRRLVGGLPVQHRGLMREVYQHFEARLRPGRYMLGMRQTMGLLADLGIEDPLCYELHTPMAINRQRYLEVWEIANRIRYPHSRTLYGNYWQLGGQKVRDVKVMSRGPAFSRSSLFLSTLPDTFRYGHVGRHIRQAFTRPCRYEQPPGYRRPPGVYLSAGRRHP